MGPFRPTPEYEAGYSCFQQVSCFLEYQNCLLPKCYSFSQPSGQTPLLQTPSSHHEPPTVPTRNTNGGSCSRSVLVYKSNVYVYAQCVCKVMCISDVCTFFDCQVPIFFIARCQYQTQRWEEIANGTWGGETDQFEVEKEMRMALSLHWHNMDFCVLFRCHWNQCVPAMSSIFNINPSSFLINVITSQNILNYQ